MANNIDYTLRVGESIDAYTKRIAEARGETASVPVVNPSTGKTAQQVLAESTAVAQRAAEMIGTKFTPGYAISPQSIAPTSGIEPVSPQYAPIYTPPELTPAQQEAQDLTKEIRGLLSQQTGRSQYQTQQENTFGVPEKTQVQNDLATKVRQLQDEATKIKLQFQEYAPKSGIAQPFVNQQMESALRTNAIEQLTANSAYYAAQGDLATARYNADRAVEQKYAPIEEEINARKANLDLIINSPEYTAQEKKQAQAQKIAQDKQAQTISDSRGFMNDILDIGNDLVSKGAKSDVVQRINDLIKKDILTKEDVVSAQRIASESGVYKPKSTASTNQPAIDYYVNAVRNGTLYLENVPTDLRNAVAAQLNQPAPTENIDLTGTTFNGLTAVFPDGSSLTFQDQASLDKFKVDNNLGGTNQPTEEGNAPIYGTTPLAKNTPLEQRLKDLQDENVSMGFGKNTGLREQLAKEGYPIAEIDRLMHPIQSTLSGLFDRIFQ